MSEQIELLPPPSADEVDAVEFIAPAPETDDERIIDRLLESVSCQHILKQLLRGKPFYKTVGLMGSTYPEYWETSAKGISVGWGPTKRLITPSAVMARAVQYQEKFRN